MADSKPYLEHLGQLTADTDPLEIQASTASAIAALMQSVPEQRLRTGPVPGKWSVVEIIAHLAEDELATSWRYRQMLEQSGCTLAGFDQDQWAAFGRYAEWDPQDAFDLFRLLRNANLRMLHSLNPEQWARSGVHAERGCITVRSLAVHMAGHDLNHLAQIRSLLQAPTTARE